MTGRGHLPFLDGIRGIAILFVFLFHSFGVSFLASQLPWHGLFRNFDASPTFLAFYPLSYGSAGVPIFFVVSGFCIHLSYKKSENQGWVNFFNRRFFRIYPAYLSAIFIFFFLWPSGNSQLSQLVTHAFAVHNFHPKTLFGINDSFWSIAVEIQLYAIYPILIWISYKFGWKRSIFLIGFIEVSIRTMQGIAESFFQTALPFSLLWSPVTFWLSWSIGAYISQCYLKGKSSKISHLRLDLAIVAAIFFPLFRPTEPFTFLAWSLLTGIIIERFLSKRWKIPEDGFAGRIWAHLSVLGMFSYSFYLLHQPILGLTRRFAGFHPVINFGVCCLLYVPICLVSYLLYCLVEQRGIAFGRTVWDQFKSSPIQPGALNTRSKA